MTRKRMNTAIEGALKDKGFEITEETKAATDVAVTCALEYVLAFAKEVSQELAGVGLYSEAMVAGVFTNKLKTLKDSVLD
jgi:hypothetical protein